jgi:hypothetical protein
MNKCNNCQCDWECRKCEPFEEDIIEVEDYPEPPEVEIEEEELEDNSYSDIIYCYE